MENFKEEKRHNFEAWVETIDERIFDWRNSLSEEIKEKTDYSIDSLEVVEEYLIENFTLECLRNQENKFLIDGAASYTIKVFEKHWKNPEYVIELDDERNILYNRPAIVTNPRRGVAFSPYMFISAIVNLKRTGIFRKNLESRL